MQAVTAITFREAYERYLHDQPPVKPRTLTERLTALKHWEELSGNRPLPLPTGDEHADLARHAEFRAAMSRAQQALAEKVAPTTVNKYFHRTLNVLLRRLSPATFTNPDGLGLVTRVYKFSKLAEEDADDCCPMSAEEVAACYACAGFARWPRASKRWPGFGIPPDDWWRAVIVFLFNIGLRTGDFLALQTSQVSLDAGTVTFQARKTSGKKGQRTKPLHPVVIEHLTSIWGAREFVFPAPKTKGARMETWATIQRWARVKPPAESGLAYYRLKDLRSTCGTDLYALSPGAAQEMLGHSSIDTTRRHYAARLDRHLAEVSLARPQPHVFLGEQPEDDPDPGDILLFPRVG